jgi:uroporphyrinogen-III decarboxylase
MITTIRLFSLLLIFVAMPVLVADGQSPEIIVQAASPVTTSSRTVQPQDSGSLSATLKLLQEMKAANEEILKKQKAVLQQLDELQKGADQIKIFSKRD